MLMRIVANLCYENPAAQDAVHDEGALPALLSAFGLDESSPYLREWAILAVRNVCLNHPRNQAYIASLQAQEIPAHVQAEMARKGVNVELGEGGKVRVSQITRGDKD